MHMLQVLEDRKPLRQGQWLIVIDSEPLTTLVICGGFRELIEYVEVPLVLDLPNNTPFL